MAMVCQPIAESVISKPEKEEQADSQLHNTEILHNRLHIFRRRSLGDEAFYL